ncbi:hypothetical protein AB5J52_17240 [Streptomyces sp. R39]|uniref:Uncharacterized protein n=1 Tax=Streptomyces sp. R39 TaxID=3238631 RepID=A0AB39QM28_9ACTN
MTVPRWGRPVETGGRYEPYRLVDADGAAVARESPPDADFHETELHRLPLPATSLGTLVRAPALAPAPAEFAPKD